MQVSMKWLRDYIDIDLTAEELADKLTMAGVPVENVIKAGAGLEKVVTGRITELKPHENSDHLQICTMDVGGERPLTIVTGAPNVAQGQVVPVALVGANLPCGKKISKGKLRGVTSEGMLCSAGELALDIEGLPEEQLTGIYILPNDTPVGVPAKDALGLDDDVLEFELTANRGDCFSVIGLVREIAVLTGKKPRWPEIAVKENDRRAADMVQIAIEAPDLCPRFSSRVLTDVKIAPSPDWLVKRLEGAGIRAINNVVDVTNFVMVELGQPMHAYDYDCVAGHRLTARRAIAGEELHTLDDSSRRAKGDELVIADGEKAAGLAGVMGGLETEITAQTTTVILEAASFNAASIRRTARACGLHSEASGRFERGVDATGTVRAIDRAAQLLSDMGAAQVAAGVVDVYPEPKPSVQVAFTPKAINHRLGTNIEAARMTEILTALGFAVEPLGEGYNVTVPSWRRDVTVWEDLSEEIARIDGFDHIVAKLPAGASLGHESSRQVFVAGIKQHLAALGLSEELSFSFTNETMMDKMRVPQDSELRRAIPIMNPLSGEYAIVRTSLLAGLFENAVRNYSRGNADIQLFEVAPVFLPQSLPITELPREVLKVGLLMTGRREPVGWANAKTMLDFYDLKGVVEELMAHLAIRGYSVTAGEHFALHPGKTAFFQKGREVIAVLGEVHPEVTAALGINQPVYVAEMDVAVLMKYAAKNFHYEPLPKYPAVSRDLAMLVAAGISAGDIAKTIAKNGGEHLKDVAIFDVYTGKQIAAGKKSLAFALTFQALSKTLTDEEVDAALSKILAAVEKEFQAELRA